MIHTCVSLLFILTGWHVFLILWLCEFVQVFWGQEEEEGLRPLFQVGANKESLGSRPHTFD